MEGHAGEFVAGTLDGSPVILQSGRYHIYEGHPLAVVSAPVRTLAELGVEILLVTNAAGGIREGLDPGEVMLIQDHINLTGTSPLIGPQVGGEARFPDMSEPYCPELGEMARAAASGAEVTLHRGVYAAMHGPAYETAAEIRMLARLGVDAVGMSTVPEVLVAKARGIACLGVSTITNRATGLSGSVPDHAEVMEIAALAGQRLAPIVSGVLRAWYTRKRRGPVQSSAANSQRRR